MIRETDGNKSEQLLYKMADIKSKNENVYNFRFYGTVNG